MLLKGLLDLNLMLKMNMPKDKNDENDNQVSEINSEIKNY